MSEYPEHDKLEAIKAESQALGEFLDIALPRMGLRLAEYVKFDEYDLPQLVPARKTITEILAEHFGIDRDVLEDEKRSMLEAIRNAQPKTVERGFLR